MAKRTPSGKFRGKVTIGYDPDGKPIYKYVTCLLYTSRCV